MDSHWYEILPVIAITILVAVVMERAHSKQYSQSSSAALQAAHELCFKNRKQELESNQVGCFYCGEIYSAREIDDYTDFEDVTALCARCGMDSVIGDASGFELTKEFLATMHSRYF